MLEHKIAIGLALLALCAGCGVQKVRSTPLEEQRVETLDKEKRYGDVELNFKLPFVWKAELLDAARADPSIHTVAINSIDDGVSARFVLLKKAPEPGAFPQKTLDALSATYPKLTRKPMKENLGKFEARGFHYTFQNDKGAWEGWVISRPVDPEAEAEAEGAADAEIAFWAQVPGPVSQAFKQALERTMRSLKIKYDPEDAPELP